MRRMIIGAVTLTLVLSACEMRAEIDVNDDGSGTFGFVFAMEQMFFGTLPSGVDPLAEARRDLRADGLPWQVEDYNERGLRGFRATIPFDSFEGLMELMEEQAKASGDGPFELGDETFVLRRNVAGGWEFQATGATPGLDAFSGFDSPSFGGDFGDPSMDFGGEFDFEPPEMPTLPGAADGILSFEVHVRLPGDPGTHNADQVKQGDGKTTFVWSFGMSDSRSMSLAASTTPAAGSFPLLPVAGVALVALGGVVWWVRRTGAGSGPPPIVFEGLPPVGEQPQPATVGAPAEPEQQSLLDDLGNDD